MAWCARALLAGFLWAASSQVPALAWGAEGHRVIADIAAHHLTQAASAEVKRLLAIEGAPDLAAISTWADDIRSDQRATAPWHYVDIPVTASTYEAQRDCPRRACVVAKIGEYAAVLANRTASDAARLRALKFVVHFVGDVHQPLHAADNGDRGGNDVHLLWDGTMANLHHIWDTELVRAAGADETTLAEQLDHAVELQEIAAISGGTVTAWANEAHGLAVEHAYGGLPPSPALTADSPYAVEAIKVVRMQLQRAGFRLAAVLNAALQ